MKLMTEIIQYIEDHLHEDLNVETVAERSGYSTHHFQKMFARVTGLSMGSYIRRRRLTNVAFQLVKSDMRIIELALEAGFESQEAFTRAFKAMFGSSPGEFRTRGLQPWLHSQDKMSESFIRHLHTGGITMEPRFIDHDGFHVMGLGQVFQRDEISKIGAELWPEFIHRLHEIENKRGQDSSLSTPAGHAKFKTYGVCQEAYANGKVQDSGVLKYSAAVEVAAETAAPSGMELIYLRPQRYAVFTHASGLGHLPQTVQYIWGTWLPKSGYKMAEAPDLEFYSADFAPDSPQAKLEIWVPLENVPNELVQSSPESQPR